MLWYIWYCIVSNFIECYVILYILYIKLGYVPHLTTFADAWDLHRSRTFIWNLSSGVYLNITKEGFSFYYPLVNVYSLRTGKIHQLFELGKSTISTGQWLQRVAAPCAKFLSARQWNHGCWRLGVTATSLGIMVNKGNHRQIAARFRLVKYYNLPGYIYIPIYIHIFP